MDMKDRNWCDKNRDQEQQASGIKNARKLAVMTFLPFKDSILELYARLKDCYDARQKPTFPPMFPLAGKTFT
jgi:hypothetical protein